MLKEKLWGWMRKVEVVCRLTLTYLVREPGEVAGKRRRDRGVEYWLARWYEDGTLNKHPVPPYVAYYLPTGKPGIRGNLEHDLFAGLAAAKLYADVKGSLPVGLSRRKLEALVPDWTLELDVGERHRYYLEFHSRRNKRRNLRSKIDAYAPSLGRNDWLLIVTQTPIFVNLPSDQIMVTTLAEHLGAGNAWTDAIWVWGEHDERHSLLSA